MTPTYGALLEPPLEPALEPEPPLELLPHAARSIVDAATPATTSRERFRM
jgi:hypothetical protein